MTCNEFTIYVLYIYAHWIHMHSLDTDIQGFTEYPVEHDVYSAGSYTCTLYVLYLSQETWYFLEIIINYHMKCCCKNIWFVLSHITQWSKTYILSNSLTHYELTNIYTIEYTIYICSMNTHEFIRNWHSRLHRISSRPWCVVQINSYTCTLYFLGMYIVCDCIFQPGYWILVPKRKIIHPQSIIFFFIVQQFTCSILSLFSIGTCNITTFSRPFRAC